MATEERGTDMGIITGKRGGLSALAVSLACALALVLGAGVQAQAAYAAQGLAVGDQTQTPAIAAQAQKNLKQLGVKFDLKKGKKVKLTANHTGQAKENAKFERLKQPFTAKVVSVKKKNAKKEGYKQAVVKVKWSSNWNPSSSTARKVWNANWGYESSVNGFAFGATYTVVCDYKTGVNLEAKNSFDVTTKSKFSGWKYSKKFKFKGTGGGWLRFDKSWVTTVTITYPESYKDLCFGVGGDIWTAGDDWKHGTDLIYGVRADEVSWFDQSKPYTKTVFYKKDKSNFHFMRIK